jgi:hypothetical protein
MVRKLSVACSKLSRMGNGEISTIDPSPAGASPMQRLRPVRSNPSLKGTARRVMDCLAYDGMMEVPEDFEAFSQADHRRRARLRPDLAWADACPAYALALATHDAYSGRMSLSADDELEAQWDELRGGSHMEWPVARMIVREAWRWLAALQDDATALRH